MPSNPPPSTPGPTAPQVVGTYLEGGRRRPLSVARNADGTWTARTPHERKVFARRPTAVRWLRRLFAHPGLGAVWDEAVIQWVEPAAETGEVKGPEDAPADDEAGQAQAKEEEPRMPQAIDPERDYAFREACRMIPSPRGGTISIRTLWRWHGQGLFRAECRTRGRRRFWYLKGSELLKLLELEQVSGPAPAPAPIHRMRTPAERRRGYERAMQRLREKGVV